MKFKDIAPCTAFHEVSPWPDTRTYTYIKAISNRTHLNAVHICSWRAGTLDYIQDDVEVVVLNIQLTG